MGDVFAVRQRSASPGWRPKFELLLIILAQVSPLLVPCANSGASNLGESK